MWFWSSQFWDKATLRISWRILRVSNRLHTDIQTSRHPEISWSSGLVRSSATFWKSQALEVSDWQPSDLELGPCHQQTSAFGWNFNRELTEVTWPSNLQTLAFGWNFNQSLVGVMLPSLKTLTFGGGFQQGLEGVTMPSSLEDLTLAQLEVGRCLTSGFAEILWLWAQLWVPVKVFFFPSTSRNRCALRKETG